MAMELECGAIAAGGGCVARAEDGRVVFVRHALPGERVMATVTSETKSFLRADAVEILDPSPDRVAPPCPHAGPGRCGGCDWQHVSLPAQRNLKAALVSEQLHRLARIDRAVDVEEVDGSPDGLGWRVRVRFAADDAGRIGLHRHRSHDLEPIEKCLIASPAVNDVGVSSIRWRGARHVEVTASDGGVPVVAVDTGRAPMVATPAVDAGLVVNGRIVRKPDKSRFEVLGHRFEVSPGVFWQVHRGAAAMLSRCVVEGLDPKAGERVADLFSGAGLFAVPLARAVGQTGSVVAVERSRRACADAARNAGGLHQIEIVRSDVTATVIGNRLGAPDVVVLDPARQGAGNPVMEALASLAPSPRRIAYVSCDPASFARDLRVMLDAGWRIRSLRGLDLFPMTEHVEFVCVLEPRDLAPC